MIMSSGHDRVMSEGGGKDGPLSSAVSVMSDDVNVYTMDSGWYREA
jgi:hypothetical protein